MEEKKKELKKEEIIKLLLIIVILGAAFVYSIFADNKEIKKFNDFNAISDVNVLFEPITNNYELIIDKTIDDKEEHVEFINDGTFKLYNINNENKGYLIYNNKTYVVELKGNKIKEYNKNESFLNDNYSNLEFIKKVIKYCNIANQKRNEVDCEIKINDFINEYNNYFNSDYEYDQEDLIVYKLKFGKIVNNINVDYSLVNQIIKNDGITKLKYNIKINKVNDNDYSELFDIFASTLKK